MSSEVRCCGGVGRVVVMLIGGSGGYRVTMMVIKNIVVDVDIALVTGVMVCGE